MKTIEKKKRSPVELLGIISQSYQTFLNLNHSRKWVIQYPETEFYRALFITLYGSCNLFYLLYFVSWNGITHKIFLNFIDLGFKAVKSDKDFETISLYPFWISLLCH
jgi:hypothetical protein